MTSQQLTPLRQRMLDDMRLRNMADGTRRSYVRSVADFSAFHGRSPDELTLEDVRDYQPHLVARGLKATSIRQAMSALRFLYAVTLDRPEQAARIPLPRKADPLPAILSRDEVARLLAAVAETLTTIAADPKHLGARIGTIAVLHTWGQTLDHHPHAHCIVPAGGISPDGGRWVACRPGFFLPVRVLSRLFRRLFLDGLAEAYHHIPTAVAALHDLRHRSAAERRTGPRRH